MYLSITNLPFSRLLLYCKIQCYGIACPHLKKKKKTLALGVSIAERKNIPGNDISFHLRWWTQRGGWGMIPFVNFDLAICSSDA